MKIQYCSDLHLEFPENYRYIQNNPLKPTGDILVIAGDFYLLSYHTASIKDFISFASDNFKEIYWLPGNHEFYHSNINSYPFSFIEKITSNFFLINNSVIKKENLHLIFSTLWSKIPISEFWQISKNVSDFHVIKNGRKKFSPENFNEQHEASLNFIKSNSFYEKDSPDATEKIVITHHVPTLKNYPAEYRGSRLNYAFASELHDFIFDSKINSWIFGHHHTNLPEFKIGETKMLTNQLGYIHYGENKGFRPDAFIEI